MTGDNAVCEHKLLQALISFGVGLQPEIGPSATLHVPALVDSKDKLPEHSARLDVVPLHPVMDFITPRNSFKCTSTSGTEIKHVIVHNKDCWSAWMHDDDDNKQTV